MHSIKFLYSTLPVSLCDCSGVIYMYIREYYTHIHVGVIGGLITPAFSLTLLPKCTCLSG